MIEIAIAVAAVTLAGFVLIWLISLPLGDASIIDIYWGPGFAVAALTGLLVAPTDDVRALALSALVIVWGLRLGIHLFSRWRGHGGEDRRYAAMRANRGSGFWLYSLVVVYGLQVVILWTVSLPVQAAQAGAPGPALGWLDLAGIAVALAGITLETVADGQLARFRQDPANAGKVLDSGLWAWSRHPNYFGDALFWWGIYLVAISGGAAWTVFAPALMTFFLMKVSGVPLLERGMATSRAGYDEYRARVPAFFPRPPRAQAPNARNDA